MEPRAPSRLKRREIVLLLIGLVIVLWTYRSSGGAPPVAPSAIALRVAALEPLDAGGSPAYVWLGWALVGLGSIVGNYPPDQVLRILSILAGLLSGVALYFAYRALFSNIYIGVVPAALLVFSPLSFSLSTTVERYGIGILFITVAVWAWTTGRWLIWGGFAGLALAVHPASATAVLPFLATTSWPRRKASELWQPVAALSLMLVVVLVGYGWVASRLGGLSTWWQNLVSAELAYFLDAAAWPAITATPLLAVVFVLVTIVGVFAIFVPKRTGGKSFVLSLVITALLFVFLVAANFGLIARLAGLFLVLLSTLSVPVLWIVEQRRQQLVFLLLWMLPSLLALWFVRQSGSALLLFTIAPLALMASRLIDRSLDGQWLDYWWALGLPTKWYYRLLKLFVLAMLVLLVVQATGVSLDALV
ncbi:MAG: glycosyltransferase family 39 protein [Chloroflexi bacterium]|nr:glycosyltransferase family 39 protein [Chloroflexota bacterium]